MKKIEKIFDGLNKIIYSILAIMMLNELFYILTLEVCVAINIWTVIIVGIMGAPGIILLGGIVLLW